MQSVICKEKEHTDGSAQSMNAVEIFDFGPNAKWTVWLVNRYAGIYTQ